jgi:hypothetical protein
LDALQNRRPGGDSVSALMFLSGDYTSLPGTGTITDKSDGSYHVSYMFTRAGPYQMQLTVSDTLAASSPYPLIVFPGPTSIAHTYGYGYLAAAAAGEYSTIYVQTRDSYGNFAVVDVTQFPNGIESIGFSLCSYTVASANQTSACRGSNIETDVSVSYSYGVGPGGQVDPDTGAPYPGLYQIIFFPFNDGSFALQARIKSCDFFFDKDDKDWHQSKTNQSYHCR